MSSNKSLELTEEEKEAVIAIAIPIAISEAKAEKGQKEFNRLYGKMTMADMVYPEFTAKEFFDLIVKMGISRSIERQWPKQFQVDEDNEAVIQFLSLYFTKDHRFDGNRDLSKFEDNGYRLTKGLLLIGDVGCGKTQLLSLCRDNAHVCYTQHDCVDISSQYQQLGVSIIDHYTDNTSSYNRDNSFGQEFYGRFFDDLGSESNAKNFGTERNVMAEIIQQRYKFHPHNMTHFTSNLTLDQLAEVYGKRVVDRLREMCNVIEFPATAKSRRR